MSEVVDTGRSSPRVIAWLSGMFFLLGMSPGFYLPALTNILSAEGLDSRFIQWAWVVGPLASLVSPVCVGSLADNRFAAEKVMGWSGLLSGTTLAVAFAALDIGLSPWLFVGLTFLSSVVAAPLWSLSASIAMSHLKAGAREFPLVRLGATFGWILAGLLTSFVLKADETPLAGYVGAGVKVLGGFLAFYLPSTPPVGRSRSWRTLLGFDAFRLLRERDHLVFFVATGLLSIPLAAFYMWTPKHLFDLGEARASATMTLGQVSEVIAMVLMASLMTRYRVKTLLTLALVMSVLRYLLFAWSGWSGTMPGLLIGISLHGMCYTFYFITAQMFLDRRVPVEMRSQAQGLLALISNGLGSLIGTVAVRYLYDYSVTGGNGGWTGFWLILAASVTGITVAFVVTYVGHPPHSKDDR